MNPFSIIEDIATAIADIHQKNDELRRKELANKRRERERLRAEKKQKEYELWKKLTEEERLKPEEFSILPYGWSPFGITL